MNNKEKYRQFCQKEDYLPIFSQAWWLDAVCGADNWDVILNEHNGEITASLPYYLKANKIVMPTLTQTMGPYLKVIEDQKYAGRLNAEHVSLEKLILQLPQIKYFQQGFCHTQTNCLPFYWHNFNCGVRYTYLIDTTKPINEVLENFTSDCRRNIKKTGENLKVHEGLSIEQFYQINAQTFERKKNKIPYSLDFIAKLDQACLENSARKIFYTIDDENNIHSALYFVYTKKYCYILAIGLDPKFKKSNSVRLLIMEAIKFACENGLILDFEGSMIREVEAFNRSFGAKQQIYFDIRRDNRSIFEKIKDKVINYIH